MQGDIMHDDERCHDDAKNKITSNYLIGVFSRVVTIDTTNKGSRPEIHVMAGKELGKLSDLHASCKTFLLDTTNKGFLLMLTMMNSRRTDLLG
jgi:hypothetical protein